ncbi:MAG: enoyl-CoA hydratase/isomerase family protein [Rhodospirillaceae bacterium]|jgi:enoyl-CoA hydratase/carnithine racemase|nr:enoyl-CoA hydratase/isomerase family protein [Rhodospirillaceae bacterium]MBT4687025.1 enoyl-CoA hydratase/isomerase family protein [Rhodospirillaceae bacterium]MBT5881588.1 enoyl-CoA hydratase/isomerase family protein [Rhodospirillaceae bacterium]MBT6430380.1 enoyl-CoA hydratase/isomerase family protein [Rhodospirillaceae bacterium]
MSKVLVDIDGPVRTITLNRPEKRNALDTETLDGMIEAFPDEPEPDERVAVVRANGPSFCSGMDLSNKAAGLGQPTSIETMLRRIEVYPLPVVAVVHGPAIAGGNELALHCDFVVASTTAIFGMSLSQIGLAPTWFLAKKLMEVAGPVAAREILLLGDPLPSTRLHDLGIIARVAEPEALEEAAKAIIDRLAANAPLSLRNMKAMLVRQMAFRDATSYDDLNADVKNVSASADAMEGIKARLERRQPTFRGE